MCAHSSQSGTVQPDIEGTDKSRAHIETQKKIINKPTVTVY